jgi:hypothetical protein
MSDADHVRQRCADLRKVVDASGLLIDEGLRSRIVEAHADGGMPPDAAVHILLASPAPPERIATLRARCRERFGAELPEDYLAFLGENDGLMVTELFDGAPDQMRKDPRTFQDHAILSTVLVLQWMESFVIDVTHPDGSKSQDRPSILPFYDLAEVGCHAFDFSARGKSGPAVVDVDGEDLWSAGGHDVIAPSFAVWLDAFIRAGFEPFRTASLLRGGG